RERQHDRFDKDRTGAHCVRRARADHGDAAEPLRRTVLQYSAAVLVGGVSFLAPPPVSPRASVGGGNDAASGCSPAGGRVSLFGQTNARLSSRASDPTA